MKAQIAAFKKRKRGLEEDDDRTARAGRGLEIPKDVLTNSEIKCLVDGLTFPVFNPFDKTSSETQTFYKIINDVFFIPRCFPSPLKIEWSGLVEGLPIEGIDFKGTLKEEQKRAFASLTSRLNEPPFATIASLPCGGGKTVLSIAIAAHFRGRTLVVVHKEFHFVNGKIEVSSLCLMFQSVSFKETRRNSTAILLSQLSKQSTLVNMIWRTLVL